MRIILRAFLGVNLLLLLTSNVQGQQSEVARPFFRELGVDMQLYPAGFITSVRGMRALSDRTALMLKVGYNLARRQDFGEHDDEKGGGPGVSAGYRYYLKKGNFEGFFAGGRLDFWLMNIKWADSRMGVLERDQSFITVLQPTFAAGYHYQGKKNWSVDAGVSFGVEWNMITRGDPVGQGGISIAFVGISKRW